MGHCKTEINFAKGEQTTKFLSKPKKPKGRKPEEQKPKACLN